jgi:hypothetical protein
MLYILRQRPVRTWQKGKLIAKSESFRNYLVTARTRKHPLRGNASLAAQTFTYIALSLIGSELRSSRRHVERKFGLSRRSRR